MHEGPVLWSVLRSVLPSSDFIRHQWIPRNGTRLVLLTLCCPLQEAFLFNSSSLHLGGPQIVLFEHFLGLKVLSFALFPFIMVGSWPWGSQFFIQLLTRACVLALPRTLANVFASVGLRMCAKWGKSFCFYVLWFFCLEYAFFLFFWGNGVLLLEKTRMTLSLSFSTPAWLHSFSLSMDHIY